MELLLLSELEDTPVWHQAIALAKEALIDRTAFSNPIVTSQQIQDTFTTPGNFCFGGFDDNGRFVGIGALQGWNPIDGTAEMAIAVKEELRREGWGLELAQTIRQWGIDRLNLRRTVNYVVPDSPVVGLAIKMGDKLEGTLKNHRYKQGRYVDVLIYAWTKES